MTSTTSKSNSIWTFCLLFVGQFLLSIALNTGAPLLYLVKLSHQDTEVREGLESLRVLSEEASPSYGGQKMMEWQAVVRPLFARVPWLTIALASSLFIFPLLGFCASWLLADPHRAAALIPLSILLGQNPLIAPLNLQTMGLGRIALSLVSMILLLALQFILYGFGMRMASHFRGRQNRQSSTVSKNP